MSVSIIKRIGHGRIAVLFLSMLCCFVTALPGQDSESFKNPFVLFLPIGYDYFKLENQTIHSPAAGIGFMYGEQDLPFNRIEQRILFMAMYLPSIFTDIPLLGIPKTYHEIGGIFDGRLGRHQILAIFQSNSDRPLSGLNTFQLGAGWGYEIVRQPNVSLILGVIMAIGDFSDMLPVEISTPVMPFPLIRFGIDTEWFASSMDFITGPNLEFTIAPKERLRFTGDMRIETYRSIADLNCEFILWYRLFNPDHRLGDFAGVGLGYKNELVGFYLSNNIQGDTFELQQSSIFAAIDLSILKIQAGWVISSNYLADGERNGSPGNGFTLSVQGMIPIINRQ
ncbi:MAG: hypothetical protein FWG77_05510 [Treponema sp.]|nr:hypothetical protein [Treponema sp.]